MTTRARRAAATLVALTLTVAGLLVATATSASAATYPATTYGQRNANVMTVQYLLNARGIPTTTDGSFGDGTAANVKTFQRSVGLTADGSVGAMTWPRLVTTVSSNAAGTHAVRAAQTQLNKYGYQLDVDGDFGTRTRNAVIAFQRSRGLAQDGSVGPVTWRELVGHSQAGDQIACWYTAGTTQSSLRPQQVANVKQVLAAADTVTTDRNAKIITLMTAMQESKFCNISSDISDRDSVGLFQQRPSMGWCTPTVGCANAHQATLGFLGRSSYTSNTGLLDFSYWNYSRTLAADKVQRSCCPYAYAQWESLATGLVNTYD